MCALTIINVEAHTPSGSCGLTPGALPGTIAFLIKENAFATHFLSDCLPHLIQIEPIAFLVELGRFGDIRISFGNSDHPDERSRRHADPFIARHPLQEDVLVARSFFVFLRECYRLNLVNNDAALRR